MPIGDAPPPLLLDTHVWIWLMEGANEEFAPSLQRVLRDADRDRQLLVSAISIWEVAMLDAGRRLQLSYDCRLWLEEALDAPGVRLEPLTPAIAVESTRLPGAFHRDPADRILVATARLASATLVTRDERILAYAERGHLRALAASRP